MRIPDNNEYMGNSVKFCEKGPFLKDFNTYQVSQRPNNFFLFVAKYDIHDYHYCQHSIEVSHCQVCAEHPRVVSEHPGPEYNQSEAGITYHL